MSKIEPKISIVIVTFSRDDVLAEQFDTLMAIPGVKNSCEVILIDNNADEVDRSHYICEFNHKHYRKMETNAGVAGGRNAGVNLSNADIVLFLDDDAILVTSDFISILCALFRNESVGIVAFHSANYYSGERNPHEFPHPNKRLMDRISVFESPFFVGVAHAVRQTIFADFRYDETFFYGMEEFDLSYYVVGGGYRILYWDDLKVRHMTSPKGRVTSAEKSERQFVNRFKVSLKYLPKRYVFESFVLRFVQLLVRTRSPKVALRALGQCYGHASNSPKQTPLSPDRMMYLKQIGAKFI